MERRLGGQGGPDRSSEAEPGGEQLDQALGVVEVGGAGGPIPGRGLTGAGEGDPQPPPFARLVTGTAVALADLEQGEILATVPHVRRDDVGEAGDEPLAEHRVIGRQRVEDRDRVAAGRRLPGRRLVIAGPGERLEVAGRHEGVADDLHHPCPDERLADRLAELQRARPPPRWGRVRQRRGDLLVAVDAGDLLGDVGLDLQVATPGRDRGDQHLVGRRVDRRGGGSRRRPRPGRRPRPSASRCRPGPGRRAARRRRARDPAVGRPAPVGRRPPARAARPARCRPGRRTGCRRPTRRPAGRSDRPRSGRGGSPGPSRSAGSPPSGARSAGRSGGC